MLRVHVLAISWSSVVGLYQLPDQCAASANNLMTFKKKKSTVVPAAVFKILGYWMYTEVKLTSRHLSENHMVDEAECLLIYVYALKGSKNWVLNASDCSKEVVFRQV